jgi:hypothetical protein
MWDLMTIIGIIPEKESGAIGSVSSSTPSVDLPAGRHKEKRTTFT